MNAMEQFIKDGTAPRITAEYVGQDDDGGACYLVTTRNPIDPDDFTTELVTEPLI